MLSLSIRHSLINPLFRLIWANPSTAAASALSRTYEPVDVDLACDIHVINLRTMQESAYKQVSFEHLEKKFHVDSVDCDCTKTKFNFSRTFDSFCKSLLLLFQDPSDEAALIVHRHGFNACYKPVGMTCSTNGGKVT